MEQQDSAIDARAGWYMRGDDSGAEDIDTDRDDNGKGSRGDRKRKRISDVFSHS